MRFTYITLEERKIIQEMLGKGTAINRIAKALGRTDSTVGNEVKRNGGPSFYNAEKAHETARKAIVKATEKSRKIIIENQDARRSQILVELETKVAALQEQVKKLLKQQGANYVSN